MAFGTVTVDFVADTERFHNGVVAVGKTIDQLNKRELSQLNRSFSTTVRSLDDQTKRLKMGEDAFVRYKLMQKGATEAMIADVEAMQKQLRALEAKKKAEVEAAAAIEKRAAAEKKAAEEEERAAERMASNRRFLEIRRSERGALRNRQSAGLAGGSMIGPEFQDINWGGVGMAANRRDQKEAAKFLYANTGLGGAAYTAKGLGAVGRSIGIGGGMAIGAGATIGAGVLTGFKELPNLGENLRQAGLDVREFSKSLALARQTIQGGSELSKTIGRSQSQLKAELSMGAANLASTRMFGVVPSVNDAAKFLAYDPRKQTAEAAERKERERLYKIQKSREDDAAATARREADAAAKAAAEAQRVAELRQQNAIADREYAEQKRRGEEFLAAMGQQVDSINWERNAAGMTDEAEARDYLASMQERQAIELADLTDAHKAAAMARQGEIEAMRQQRRELADRNAQLVEQQTWEEEVQARQEANWTQERDILRQRERELERSLESQPRRQAGAAALRRGTVEAYVAQYTPNEAKALETAQEQLEELRAIRQQLANLNRSGPVAANPF